MLNELLAYCSEQFDGNGGCPGCARECTQSCENCLRAIHWETGERYRCTNSVYFYVGKHVPRYAAEIQYLLENIVELRDFDSFKVLSLGSGPCSDMWGVINFNIENNLNKNIHYIGYDINNIWSDVIRKNKELVSSITDFRVRYGNVVIDIVNNDFFDAIRDRNAIKANMVLLQYVISDMVKNNIDMTDFLNNLYNDLISRLPVNSVVILNDINHNTAARNYFDELQRIINRNSTNNRYVYSRYHFRNDFRQAYAYGTQHTNNRVNYYIADEIKTAFDPWMSCQSAQLVIRKMA